MPKEQFLVKPGDNPQTGPAVVLPIGSNIPIRAVVLPNAQLVDYRAAGGLNRGSVEAKFYVRQGQLTLVDRSRSEALVVRMESGTGPATNVPEAEALERQGPLPRGIYRILSRTKDGSDIYKHTGFKGYILAPIDRTPFNDRYDAFGRGNFRMHFGTGVGCLTTFPVISHASKAFSIAPQRCPSPL